MDRTFRITLEKEEYLEYLNHQLIHSGKMRGSRWFLLTSVPAVLITGMLLLRNVLESGNLLFFTSMLALAAFWVLYGARAVWKRHIRRKVEGYYWPKLNIREFKEVRYHFDSGGVEYQDSGRKVRIAYGEMQALLPLEKEFVLYHTKGAILLPYRIFENEGDIKDFLKEYEKSCMGAASR